MKKLLTLLFIIVSLSAFSQNVFRYQVIDSNDVTISAATFGNLLRSPIFNLRNNYGRYFQDFRWSGQNHTITWDSLGVFSAWRGYDFGNSCHHTIAFDEGEVQISLNTLDDLFGYNIRWRLNQITIGSNERGILIDTITVQPSDSGKLNLGSTENHWDTAWIDHIHNIYSGVYKPDTSAGTDITDFVIDSASYTRVGNVVTVNGYISDLTTGSSGTSSIQLSLPIASNIARVGQLSGVTANGSGQILGNTTTDRAVVPFGLSLTNSTTTFSFSYLIY